MFLFCACVFAVPGAPGTITNVDDLCGGLYFVPPQYRSQSNVRETSPVRVTITNSSFLGLNAKVLRLESTHAYRMHKLHLLLPLAKVRDPSIERARGARLSACKQGRRS